MGALTEALGGLAGILQHHKQVKKIKKKEGEETGRGQKGKQGPMERGGVWGVREGVGSLVVGACKATPEERSPAPFDPASKL